MASVPTVKAPGLFTQRHVDALYSVPSIFTPETIHKATLPTGVTVEYALLGAGPVIATAAGEAPSEAHEDRVVMVMGFSQHKEEWAPFIRMLFDKYKNGGQKKPLRILTLDNRGIGGTDAPLGRYRTSDMAQDVLALMSHVGWERAHVVGFSMGGMISLELAAQAPERVRSLSLMVTTRGKFSDHPNAKGPMRQMMMSRDLNRIVDSMMKLMYPDDCLGNFVEASDMNLGDILKAFYIHQMKQLSKPSIRGIVGQYLAVSTHFVSDERLEMIKNAGFPVLIVGSMKDGLIPSTESIKLMELMNADHVKPLFFADGGHGVFIQFMDEVADGLVGNFARSSL